MEKKSVYDCYIGVLARSSSLATLSSIKMATALGQLVLVSVVEKLGLPSRVYNLDVTDWPRAKDDMIAFMKHSRRPLIGFTLVAGNVDDSLKLATWFKKRGADVILGGPEITYQTAEYYHSLPTIDGVIIGAAEHIIPQIMIEGLQSQDTGWLKVRQEFDFENANVNYELLFGLEADHGGVSYVWGGDCHLRNNRCFFCSRQLKGFGWRDPDKVWDELRIPLGAGKKYYYNNADTIAVRPDLFAKFVRARPTEFASSIHKCFINATQINDQIAELLCELNGLAAIGIESFSNLKGSGKGKTTDRDNWRAIELLSRHNVKMVLTFVLGLPGETTASLQKNAEALLKVLEEYGDSIFMVTVSPLLITIGSRAFEVLIQKCGLPKVSNGAYYDPLALSEQYYGQFCDVDRNSIISCINMLYHQVQELRSEIIFDSKGISKREEKYIQNQ